MSPETDKMLPEKDREDIQREYDIAGRTHQCEPISWRCKYGWHQWSKWWNFASGDVLNSGGVAVGHYLEQRRLCFGCRMMSIHKERS